MEVYMINGLLLQCGHKVIISMNKREISKEIIPFFFSKSSSYTNILHENFLSLEIEKLLLTLDDLLEKKACEQIYSETENYYRINIITKEKNKKYIINIFKYSNFL